MTRSTSADFALLPAGLHDVLAPMAEHEVQLVETLMAGLQAHGYERVKPPMVEYESALLSGFGAGLASQTFRLQDPISQNMLAVRPDMTVQIARLAYGRLANRPRPLRLCYRGEVLRVQGTDLRPERQFQQAGCELIGSLAPAADAEAITLAARGLIGLGVDALSVDLTLPTLVPALMSAFAADDDDRRALLQAIDRRDQASAAAMSNPAGPVISRLLDASGRADRALDLLREIDLPNSAFPDRDRLFECVDRVRDAVPGLMLTVDLVEQRGFEYQTGVSFTLFARGVRGELGRGGRYRLGAGLDADAPEGEPATGFTIYVDTLLRALPPPIQAQRLYLPYGTPSDQASRWQGQGWITLAGLTPEADAMAEARRLQCSHILLGETPQPVELEV